MSYEFYWIILLIIYGISLFMGLHLIFGKVSRELEGGNYHIAKRYAGAAFTLAPIAGYTFYFFKITHHDATYLATAVNLTVFYASAILLGTSTLKVIGHRSDKLRKKVVIMCHSYVAFLILVWGAIALGKIECINICHIIANIQLCILVIVIVGLSLIIYRRTAKRIDNYYSDEIKSHIFWIAKSIYLFVGLGVVACISPFSNDYNLWLCLFYSSYQLFVYIYVYNSMQRFELISLSISLANDEKEIETIPTLESKTATISGDTKTHIEKEIAVWIANGGYTVSGITVKAVATQIYTNRTYLSAYINTTYNCNFKTWITNLRINESKKLLCDNKFYTTMQIADMIGFSSSQTYIKTFTSIEGKTPNDWRDEQMRIKNSNQNINNNR